MTDPRVSRFCPGWDTSWHLSWHTSQQDVRLANALSYRHRPHPAWDAFPEGAHSPEGDGQPSSVTHSEGEDGGWAPNAAWLLAQFSAPPGLCLGRPPAGQPDTPPPHFCAHLHGCRCRARLLLDRAHPASRPRWGPLTPRRRPGCLGPDRTPWDARPPQGSACSCPK